jgi:hypothetical protein
MTGFESQASRITDTENGQYGSRFELNEAQHVYEINFAKMLATTALEKHKRIHIIDFGCGNGDMASGIVKKIQQEGYEDPVLYTGFDLDSNGIETAQKLFSHTPSLENSDLSVIDLRNIDALRVKLSGINLDAQIALLFCDSLHWLQPPELEELLSMVYSQTPLGAKVLATVCSVWNPTSIGSADNPRQQQHIDEIQSILEAHPFEALGRQSSQIEYKSAMTHFSDLSLQRMFEKSGFVVEDSSYCRNIFFPNGTPDKPENVKLTAVKK